MKALGLIVEYNPFHNGHLFHLEESKKLAGADFTVCVMSGNFIQRGEPAIVSKWARTNIALHCGIDLVLELPVVYAMASAEFFAYGAVKILDSLGIINHICFGSENGRLEELHLIAKVLSQEPAPYQLYLKEALNKGLSYPSSRENALKRYFEEIYNSDINLEGIIGTSNNILGIEYLKALEKLKSSIVPLTIQRLGNSYNCSEVTGQISSATSIRKCIYEEGQLLNDYLDPTLPQASLNTLLTEFSNGKGPVFSQSFSDLIIWALRKMAKEQIRQLPYVNEGLENRIKDAAHNTGTINALIEEICTRRYTKTRVQRILLSTMTGLTNSEFETFNQHGGPQYIRVLGFNQKGTQLLKRINKVASLPVIVKTADFKNSCNPLLKRMLEIESQSTDAYVMAYKNPAFKKAGQEFTQNVVRI